VAHSLHYHIGESIRAIEIEVGKLLDLATTLKETGDEGLATSVSIEAHKLIEVAVALRIAVSR
jgi:hypothetical protein